MSSTSIFKEEQKNIMANFKKNKEKKKFFLWLLVGLLITLGVSYIMPTINSEKNIIAFGIVFILSIVFILVDFAMAIKFIEKTKIVKVLYVLMCLIVGVILKIGFENCNMKNIFICSSIVIMYYSVVAIITLKYKKLYIFVLIIIPALCYLCYKYLTLNAGIILVVFNTITLSLTFVLFIKDWINKYKKEEESLSLFAFIVGFAIESIFLSNLI